MAKARKGKGKGYIIPQDDEVVEHALSEHEAAYEVKKEEHPVAEAVADVVSEAIGEMAEDVAEMLAVAEVEEDNAKPNSVVHPRFKDKYLANARALGIPGKAAKRSNWDWLSQQIAKQCLTDKHKLKVIEFHQLMAANGIDATKWNNRNKGWEGRLRMTGRVALQKKVANANALHLLDGTTMEPPTDFVAKFRDKE